MAKRLKESRVHHIRRMVRSDNRAADGRIAVEAQGPASWIRGSEQALSLVTIRSVKVVTYSETHDDAVGAPDPELA